MKAPLGPRQSTRPRVALALAAIVMSLLTQAVLVLLPARVESASTGERPHHEADAAGAQKPPRAGVPGSTPNRRS